MKRRSLSNSRGLQGRKLAAKLQLEPLEARDLLAGLVMDESVFSAALFAANIEEQVLVDVDGPNGVVGYTYAIIDGNPSLPLAGGGGAAVVSWDAPGGKNDIAADPDRGQDGASTAKLITGATIMHLLQERNPGLSGSALTTALQAELNQPIVNYLPATWAANGWTSNFSTITIAELLTHSSGLRGGTGADGWDSTSTLPGNPVGSFTGGGTIYNYVGLQQLAQFGNVDPSKPTEYWTNNFAWLRVMLPYLWNAVDNAALDANAASNLLPTDPRKTPFSPMISADRVLADKLIDAMIGDWGSSVAPNANGVMAISPGQVTASIYKYYVSNNLLIPAGVANPQSKTTGSYPTLLYPLDPTIVPGTEIWPLVEGGTPTPQKFLGFDTGDLTEDLGPRGWNLSAKDLARAFWAVRYGVNGSPFLEDATLDLMDAQGLGWQHSTNSGLTGDFGQYWGHNGINFRPGGITALTVPSPNVPSNAQLGSMNNTSAIVFNNGVAASLLINSQIQSETAAINSPSVIGAAFNPTSTPTGMGTNGTLIDASDNAWTDLVYEGDDDADDEFTIQTNSTNPAFLDIVTPTGTFTRRIDTLHSLTIRGLGGDDDFIVIDLPGDIQLTLEGGDGDDEFWIDAVDEGVRVMLSGDAGDDVFYASDAPRNLESVNHVTFLGGADVDRVELNDHINNNPFDHAHKYFLGADQLHRQAGPLNAKSDVDLFFSDVETINLTTSLAPFDDFVEVLSTGGSAFVQTGLGDDSIAVAGDGKNLDLVRGLTFDLGLGVDTVVLYDQNNPWANPLSHAYWVSETTVERFGSGPLDVVAVHMAGIESLELFASDADDVVRLETLPIYTSTIHLGEGDDTAITTSGNLEDVDEMLIIGGKGEDQLILDDGMNPYGVPDDGSFPLGIPTANTYEVSASRVRRDGSGIGPNANVASNINVDYQEVEHLSLIAAQRGDVFHVSGGGEWTTDLTLGEGNDVVYASAVEQNIEFVDGLFVHGNSGKDELYLYDAHNPYSHVQSKRYEVAADHVSRFRDVHGPGQTHMPQGTAPADAVDVLVQMESVEVLDVETGDQGDEVRAISSTSSGTA
ncbi:MAG: serine hydrolase, partial [Planctomycetales bacterium]|nr:serine hydrolase [Planctomycetales bacterium]